MMKRLFLFFTAAFLIVACVKSQTHEYDGISVGGETPVITSVYLNGASDILNFRVNGSDYKAPLTLGNFPNPLVANFDWDLATYDFSINGGFSGLSQFYLTYSDETIGMRGQSAVLDMSNNGVTITADLDGYPMFYTRGSTSNVHGLAETRIRGFMAFTNELSLPATGPASGTGILSVNGNPYWWNGSAFSLLNGGSGTSTFLGLTDTPASYTANRYPKVNGTGTGLVWYDIDAVISAHTGNTLNPHAVTIGQLGGLTANRLYYVNNSGVLTPLALGSAGTALYSNGATSAPTWNTAADVFKYGTPVDNQLAVWRSNGVVEGEPELLYNGTTLTVSGDAYVTGSIYGTNSLSVLGSGTNYFANAYISHFNLGGTSVISRTAGDAIVLTDTHGSWEVVKEIGWIYNDINSLGISIASLNTNLNGHIANVSNPHSVTIGQLGGLTANRLYYVNNSGVLTALAFGASGTYLRSGGTTSAPTWVNPIDPNVTITSSAGRGIIRGTSTGLLLSVADGGYIGIGESSDSNHFLTIRDRNTTPKLNVLQITDASGNTPLRITNAGAITLGTIAADESETHVVAIDNITGNISKRSVASFGGAATTFKGLLDTPNDFTGLDGYALIVDETNDEVDAIAPVDISDFIELKNQAEPRFVFQAFEPAGTGSYMGTLGNTGPNPWVIVELDEVVKSSTTPAFSWQMYYNSLANGATTTGATAIYSSAVAVSATSNMTRRMAAGMAVTTIPENSVVWVQYTIMTNKPFEHSITLVAYKDPSLL